MAEHLETLGIRSWRTRWLIDYACRDDYGCTAAQTSAFAGLHHFLSRGLEEHRDAYLLTGPEGNGRLVKGLAELAELGPRLHLDTLVTQLDPESGELRSWHATEDRVRAWKAAQVIWAALRFVLSRVLERDPHAAAVAESSYAPWLVANLSLRRAPRGAGAPLAWDNVAIEGDDLGYVVATHGEGGRPPDAPAQVTFYQAFAAPGAELRKRRAELLAGDAAHWGRYVMDRMRRMHDDIDELVTQLRIHRWGHAMIRPTPEALFGSAAQRRRASIGRVHPCGTDTQGLALFEEAFYAGHEAAETVIAALAGSEATAERG